MSKIGWFLIVLVAVFIAIQFIPVPQNRIRTTTSSHIFEKSERTPANVAAILNASCYDCHSNTTHDQWYSKLQPAAWWMARHIQKGREDLNFDEFNNYSDRRKKAKIKSIISQIEKDEMPLKSYQMMHPGSKLSLQNKKELLNFFNKLN